MENKYYLKSVELIEDKYNAQLYYECLYSNGFKSKTEIYVFKSDLSIPIEL